MEAKSQREFITQITDHPRMVDVHLNVILDVSVPTIWRWMCGQAISPSGLAKLQNLKIKLEKWTDIQWKDYVIACKAFKRPVGRPTIHVTEEQKKRAHAKHMRDYMRKRREAVKGLDKLNNKLRSGKV